MAASLWHLQLAQRQRRGCFVQRITSSLPACLLCPVQIDGFAAYQKVSNALYDIVDQVRGVARMLMVLGSGCCYVWLLSVLPLHPCSPRVITACTPTDQCPTESIQLQVKNYLKKPWDYPRVEELDAVTFKVGASLGSLRAAEAGGTRLKLQPPTSTARHRASCVASTPPPHPEHLCAVRCPTLALQPQLCATRHCGKPEAPTSPPS